MASIIVPKYELIRRGRWGRLLEDYTYHTPITGFAATWASSYFRCMLLPNGHLTVYCLSEWDFGSGPAINTPAMVYASIPHDAFCHLTDNGILPWGIRAKADLYLWDCLTRAGATVSRFWRVPAVMIYSQTVARWRRKK